MNKPDALTQLVKNHVREFHQLLDLYKAGRSRNAARRKAVKSLQSKYNLEFQTLCKKSYKTKEINE